MKKNKEKKPINKATLVLSIVSGVIALVLIASIFVQFRTINESKELDIEGMRDDELRTQIASYRSRYEETMEQYNANQNTINEYETAINENQETTELLDQEVEQANYFGTYRCKRKRSSNNTNRYRRSTIYIYSR